MIVGLRNIRQDDVDSDDGRNLFVFLTHLSYVLLSAVSFACEDSVMAQTPTA